MNEPKIAVIYARNTELGSYENLRSLMNVSLLHDFSKSVPLINAELLNKKVSGTKGSDIVKSVYIKRLDNLLNQWEKEYDLKKNKDMSLKWHRKDDAQTNNLLKHIYDAFNNIATAQRHLVSLSVSQGGKGPVFANIKYIREALEVGQSAWATHDKDALQKCAQVNQADLLYRLRMAIKYFSSLK